MAAKALKFIWFAILIFLIIYTPIPFASVLPYHIFIIEIMAAFLFVLSLILSFMSKESKNYKFEIKMIKPLVGLLVLIIIQLTPLPSFLIKILSPKTLVYKNLPSNAYLEAFAKIYEKSHSENLLDGIKYFRNSLSLYPFASLYKLIFLLSLGLIFLAIIFAVQSKKEIRLLLKIIIFSGFLQSFIYFLSYLRGYPIFDKLYGYEMKQIMGTFINRDHYSAYLNMILPVLAGWIFYYYNSFCKSSNFYRFKLLRFIQYENGIPCYMAMIFVLIGVGQAFSLSRAGISSAFIAFASLVYLLSNKKGKMQISTIVIILVLSLCGLLYWIGYYPIVYRFKLIPLEWQSEAGRWAVWKDSFSIIKDFPLFGIGLANFNYQFSHYKSFYSERRFSYAHNDFLQALVELGIIGFLLLVIAIYYFYKQVLSYPWEKGSRTKAIVFGIISSTFAILIHSFFDFPMQIPANALLFTILIACLFAFIKINTSKSKLAISFQRK